MSRGWVTLYEAPDPLADVTADEGGAPPAKEARRPPQANRKGWGVKPKPGQGAKKARGDAGGDGDVERMLANTSFVTVPLREPDEGTANGKRATGGRCSGRIRGRGRSARGARCSRICTIAG